MNVKSLFGFGFVLLGLVLAPRIWAQELASKDKKILPPIKATAKLPASKPSVSSSPLSLTQFQIGPVLALQGKGPSASLLLRYLPEYSFGKFGLGLDFGISSFENTGTPAFIVGEIGAQASYLFNPNWGVRLISGLQSWSANNGVAFFSGPEAEYHFRFDRQSWFDGVFLSYNMVSQSTRAHLFSTGITLKF